MTSEKKADWALVTLMVMIAFLLGALSGIVDDDWQQERDSKGPCDGAPYRGHRQGLEGRRNNAG